MPSSRATRRALSTTRTGITSVLAWAVGLVIAFPLFWMISSSLKAPKDILAIPSTLLPVDPTLQNYQTLASGDFPQWFLNSVIISVGTVIPVLVLGSLSAYSITRFRYPGRRSAAVLLLFAYLFPSVLMIVPLFIMINNLGLANTYIGLILANMTYALPVAIWLLRSFFAALSVQVEEAALIDGAPRLIAFAQVVIPQVAPGLVSTGIFTSITSWGNYLFAVVFISSPSLYTLPLGIANYSDALNVQWGPLMASSVLTTVPVLLIFMLLQRRFFRGFGIQGSR